MKKKAVVVDEENPGLSDPGQPPRMEWVEKGNFIIDNHYQRSIESKASVRVIRQIVANFSWRCFAPPTVTPAGDTGKYIVIDGQHRIEGARQRPDITTIPVYIVDHMTRQEQARAFVRINEDRVALNGLSLYRAQLAMGDREALAVQEVCEEAEVSICKYTLPGGLTRPRETLALGTIKKGLENYGFAPVLAALMIIPDTFKLTPGMLRAAPLAALMEFFFTRGVENVDTKILSQCLGATDPHTRELEARMKAKVSGGRAHQCLVLKLNQDYEAKEKKNG